MRTVNDIYPIRSNCEYGDIFLRGAMRLLTSCFCFLMLIAPSATYAHENHTSAAQKRAYILNHIALLDVQVKRLEGTVGPNNGILRFDVLNKGPETLNKVKVQATFTNESGQILHRQTYLPVYNSAFDFANSNGSLSSGQTRQLKRDQFYPIHNLDPKWSGNITLEVIDVEFAH